MSADLINGSAATVLQRTIGAASVDMIYADPPFGNEQVWSGRAGTFSDRWEPSADSLQGWTALRQHSEVGADLMATIAPDPRAQAYLGSMAGILLGCRRVLKPTGTLWLHFDDTMGAHLRIMGDVVFGPELQLGTVIWRRSSSHNSRRGFGRVHDTIACWMRSRAAKWRLARCRGEVVFGDPCERLWVGGLLEDRLTATSKERVGYPTQKPVALLERIIRSGSLPGDLVLDPTCGSGTTLVAAQGLGRRAIGIDASPDAVDAARSRLKAAPRQLAMFEAAA